MLNKQTLIPFQTRFTVRLQNTENPHNSLVIAVDNDTCTEQFIDCSGGNSRSRQSRWCRSSLPNCIVHESAFCCCHGRDKQGAGLWGIEQWNTGFTSGFVFPYSTRNQLVNHVSPRYAIDLSSVLVLFYIVYIPYTCYGEIISG